MLPAPSGGCTTRHDSADVHRREGTAVYLAADGWAPRSPRTNTRTATSRGTAAARLPRRVPPPRAPGRGAIPHGQSGGFPDCDVAPPGRLYRPIPTHEVCSCTSGPAAPAVRRSRSPFPTSFMLRFPPGECTHLHRGLTPWLPVRSPVGLGCGYRSGHEEEEDRLPSCGSAARGQTRPGAEQAVAKGATAGAARGLRIDRRAGAGRVRRAGHRARATRGKGPVGRRRASRLARWWSPSGSVGRRRALSSEPCGKGGEFRIATS